MDPAECRQAYTKTFQDQTSGTGLPAFVACRCGGELWGRNDRPELHLATVMGHTLMHYGGENHCGPCIKTGTIMLFRAWLLSSSEDRELIALTYTAVNECVSRRHILTANQNEIAHEASMDCPRPCRQRALAWCQGMGIPGMAFDLLDGVAGDLTGSLRDDMTALCDSPGVNMPPEYASLHPYLRGLATLYCYIADVGPGCTTGHAVPITHRPVRKVMYPSLDAYVRERLADGYWMALDAGVDSPTADDFYFNIDSVTLKEYAIDTVCAFDTFTHERALKEDALYGACDYERNREHEPQTSPPSAYQDIIYSAGYVGLSSFVWGAKVHLDVLRGQATHSPSPPPDHWYARVWHDALLGQSTPGVLYQCTIAGKTSGISIGDRKFTGCEPECSCPKRYHDYGLGATISWTREAWCGLPCSSKPFDVWMFGAFVDAMRSTRRCGEGRPSPVTDLKASAARPMQKACIGDLAQVRCQIVHLLVWCAIDKQSAAPRPGIGTLCQDHS
ncbi:hypothetical protein BDV25DRAFT_172355 [Aspergillus avenaceus]|uniref:Uncharacterized protein n=1 Tax=Aspergillus avenaceus TaxID=36643 RepID=A0A5N6U6R4_ASPAV|nr:hypothetical protein BDV25DRAFT_172355 [Aspergillus avenaceus]